jgi:hypothetical protein
MFESHCCAQSELMKMRYPDRVPIQMHFDEKIKHLVQKSKFMVPRTLMCSEFISTVRQRMLLDPSSALFFLIIPKNSLMPPSALVGQLYDNEKDNDGFLHVFCKCEDTFGSAP